MIILPTRVNIINDSGERIKLKIDNKGGKKYDEIVNVESGGRLDGIEGSDYSWNGFDVVVDIIINPVCPKNKTRLGGIKFNNPTVGDPIVSSDEFTTLGIFQGYEYELKEKVARGEGRPKRYWGKLNEAQLTEEFPGFGKTEEDFNAAQAAIDRQIAVLVNSAPKPTFTIESFFIDSVARAKVWDLRINSYNFTL